MSARVRARNADISRRAWGRAVTAATPRARSGHPHRSCRWQDRGRAARAVPGFCGFGSSRTDVDRFDQSGIAGISITVVLPEMLECRQAHRYRRGRQTARRSGNCATQAPERHSRRFAAVRNRVRPWGHHVAPCLSGRTRDWRRPTSRQPRNSICTRAGSSGGRSGAGLAREASSSSASVAAIPSGACGNNASGSCVSAQAAPLSSTGSSGFTAPLVMLRKRPITGSVLAPRQARRANRRPVLTKPSGSVSPSG